VEYSILRISLGDESDTRGSQRLGEEQTELMMTGEGKMDEILPEGGPRVTFQRGLFAKGMTRKKKVERRLHRSICDAKTVVERE